MSVPSTSVASMPYFGASVSTTQRQEPNSARAATIWSPALRCTEDRRRHRRHAGGRGARILGAFQRAHALFEHVDGRVGVARIDEARLLALEARFGRLRALVDIALGEVHRLGGLAEARNATCRHARVWSAVSSCASWSLASVPQKQKNRPRKSQPVHTAFGQRSFSDLFNVAASRPAKSPRDNDPLDPRRACVNSRGLVKTSVPAANWSEALRAVTGILPDREIAALFAAARSQSPRAARRATRSSRPAST